MLNYKELNKIIKKILKKRGLRSDHAKIAADAIINAELVGAHSHGISRLKMYCDRIDKNLINPKPKLKLKKISNSILSIDADNSIGFVSGMFGILEGIKSAKKNGISLVSIKNSNHFGLTGYYLEKATKQNLIALGFTNAPPAIAPYGSKKSLFGTNPIAFGVSLKNKAPFILDCSMSMINRGKIRVAAKLNKKIPADVALDKFGNKTSNAVKALEGVQLPISTFKGSGLAWMVDILSGTFTGSAHGGKVRDPFDDFKGPQNVGHLFILFKQNLFVKDFAKRIKINIQKIKNLPKSPKFKKIYYPGENKYERYKMNTKAKIKIPKKIYKELFELLGK